MLFGPLDQRFEGKTFPRSAESSFDPARLFFVTFFSSEKKVEKTIVPCAEYETSPSIRHFLFQYLP